MLRGGLMRHRIIGYALLVMGLVLPFSGEASGKDDHPRDWPAELGPLEIHGRMLAGKLTADESNDAAPHLVKIRIGVNNFGDIVTMKVLSGDKALIKDAKAFLLKCKFPKDPDEYEDPVVLSEDLKRHQDVRPSTAHLVRSQTYEITFSAIHNRTPS